MAVGASLNDAQAFSLAGPRLTWQDTSTGHNPNDINDGVVGINEEYRFTVPNLYYAFDLSFLEYFGTRGVAEVEKAFQIINDLPRFSDLNVNDYPLQSIRVNYQAQTLGLLDLKSQTLKMILRQLGLNDPQRFVFTLRSRWVVQQSTNYLVIKRNYDPETYLPTSFINGQLWTYQDIFDFQSPDAGVWPQSFVINEPVDALQLAEPATAGSSSFTWNSTFGAGNFHTGLTRDDVGGLKYLYRNNNVNAETGVPNTLQSAGQTSTAGTGALAGIGFGGGAFGIPITTTNTGGVVLNPGNPFGIPTISTNQTGVAGGGQGAALANTNNFTAPKFGVDTLNFSRLDLDPILGTVSSPFTDSYSETFITTNGVVQTGTASRVIVAPDIIFSAKDLIGLGAITFGTGTLAGFNTVTGGNNPDFGNGNPDDIPTALNQTSWQNNDTLNGLQTQNGPGQNNTGGLPMTYNTQTPLFLNYSPGTVSEPSQPYLRWGAFDGSTNAPVVFPDVEGIRAIEEQIISGRR